MMDEDAKNGLMVFCLILSACLGFGAWSVGVPGFFAVAIGLVCVPLSWTIFKHIP